jgi:hypothetical protein
MFDVPFGKGAQPEQNGEVDGGEQKAVNIDIKRYNGDSKG